MSERVFISYSRRDKAFVRALHDSLVAAGRDAWVDWEDIPLSADWWREICTGIEGADAFVFVISPDSVRSTTCFREIEHAAQHNKRIMPLLLREVIEDADRQRMHPAVDAHNWIYFDQDGAYPTQFAALVEALDTDLTYVREHTRLLVRARSWENRQRDPSLLLRGNDLREAEAWLASGLDKPRNKPTELHCEYITKSRRAQNRLQRRNQIISAVVTLIVGLMVLSLVLYVQARDARDRAKASAAEALAAKQQAEEQGEISSAIGLAAQAQLELFGSFPERGVLLALEALDHYPYVWQAERALSAAVLGSRARARLTTGSQPVNGVDWSPDGTKIVTGSADNNARVWDLANPTAQPLILAGHVKPVTDAVWSPQGDRIATASVDGTVKTWDATTGAPLQTMFGPRAPNEWLLNVAWAPDESRIAATGTDGKLYVWDAVTGLLQPVQIQASSAQGSTWLSSVDWSPDSERLVLATADADPMAAIYDAATGELLHTLRHPQAVTSARWSPDGAHIVTGSDDDIARVWDVATETQVLALPGNVGGVTDAVWSRDGRMIVTASNDRTARVWDAGNGALLLTLSGHTDEVLDVAWSPDQTRIVTASQDGSARIWDALPDDALAVLRGAGSVLGAAWDADGARVLTWSNDGKARIWVPASGATRALPHGARANGAAWGPDQTRVLTWSRDKTAVIWDASDGTQIQVLTHDAEVNAGAWSADGSAVVTGSSDGRLRVWNPSTGYPSLTVLVGSPPIRYLAWSPTSAQFAAALNRKVAVWDAAWGTEQFTLDVVPIDGASVLWSPQGDRLLTLGQDGSARLWDGASGAALIELPGDAEDINAAAWSPDGALVAVAGESGIVRVWNANSGELVRTLAGHTEAVTSVAWSPNGQRLITGSADRTARVWDMASGEELLRLTGHTGDVLAVAWSPDEQRVVTTGADATARVWPAWQTREALTGYARTCCAIRDLTKEERAQFNLPAAE